MSTKLFLKFYFCKRGGLLASASGARYLSNKPQPKERLIYPEGQTGYENDYADKAEYPEIDKDTHRWTHKQRTKQNQVFDWHSKIRNAPNPEAKTFEMNLPRLYGWRCRYITEEAFPYDSLNLYKFITKTSDIREHLPECYNTQNINELSRTYAEKLGEQIQNAIRFELKDNSHPMFHDLGVKETTLDYELTSKIVEHVNRIILNELSADFDHLKKIQVDSKPNVQSFWICGGHQPSNAVRSSRISHNKTMKETVRETYTKQKIRYLDENAPVNVAFAYKGSPVLQLRCENSLPYFISDYQSCLITEDNTESMVFPYELSCYNISRAYRFASFIPGVWTGDPNYCNHTSFHSRSHLLAAHRKNKYFEEDSEDAICSQAALSSFGKLLAQAMYFGYDQFTDIQKPICTQTIVTNGLTWSFFAYQLNTIQMEDLAKNKKHNIMWKSSPHNILASEDSESLNLDTLSMIIKFYLQTPLPSGSDTLSPYITEPLQLMEDEHRREIIYFNFKDMISQRWYNEDSLLHRQYPEIYEWERIYKVLHPQRHMDARRRFFELPSDYPGAQPYYEPYKVLDPRYMGKRMKQMVAELEKKKSKDALTESKRLENQKFKMD